MVNGRRSRGGRAARRVVRRGALLGGATTWLRVFLALFFVLAACAPSGPSGTPGSVGPKAGEPAAPGGELTFIVGAEPPSFDGHRETSFAMLHWTAPHYSLLVRLDPDKLPTVVPDVAERWSVSQDGLTYTFNLRRDVKFHDGSPLTSKDVKATYEKIVNPPPGVVSARKASYEVIDKIETPDEATVVFRLKWPSASMLANFASPWNFLYKAEILERDPRWYEKNIMGSGPFTFVEYVPGSHWVGKKNPDYFVKDRPYLDGFRAIFVRDASAQVAAVRGGRAQVEFRGFPPAARDDLVRAMGTQITVQESPWVCVLYVALNNEKRPFDDVRVRRALNLAIDRWGGSRALSQITFVKGVGAVMRPGGPFAMPESELVKMPGWGRDANAARNEARRLLREAGVGEGFQFVLKNRDVREPYEAVGVFLIDQWKQIGLNVSQVTLETGPYTNDLRAGNYDAALDFNCDFMDEPDLQLIKFVSAEKSPINYSRYKDATLDDLYERQSRETDAEKRKQLVWEFERRAVGEMAYQLPTIWWHRIVPHAARLRGWTITPSHYLNQDLRDVWLAKT
jgi:peptide/nickel transport system substrate-binding protein